MYRFLQFNNIINDYYEHHQSFQKIIMRANRQKGEQ
jgi:hypothetical protein